jgi:lysophospholipase
MLTSISTVIDSVLRLPGLRGLILETFGAGNAPSGPDNILTDIIKAAVARGIVIVNVSQCQSGSVSPLYAPATVLGNAGVVFGHDLTTEAALTKLSFLLAVEDVSYDDLVLQMQISLRGEMTEIHGTQFSHPSSEAPSLTATQTAFTGLGYAITLGDLDAVTQMLISDQTLLGAKDYAENTALHLAAVGPNPMILRELLKMGASVHVRNRAGSSPLFLAQQVGATENEKLLREAGAHLHVQETETQRK